MNSSKKCLNIREVIARENNNAQNIVIRSTQYSLCYRFVIIEYAYCVLLLTPTNDEQLAACYTFILHCIFDVAFRPRP